MLVVGSCGSFMTSYNTYAYIAKYFPLNYITCTGLQGPVEKQPFLSLTVLSLAIWYLAG